MEADRCGLGVRRSDGRLKSLARQTQNGIDVAPMSLAPLVERVLPALVNISVELKEPAAKQGEQGNRERGCLTTSDHDRSSRRRWLGSAVPGGLARFGGVGALRNYSRNSSKENY